MWLSDQAEDDYHQRMMNEYQRSMQQQIGGLSGLLGGYGQANIDAAPSYDSYLERMAAENGNKKTYNPNETIRQELQRETNAWLKDAL